MSADEVFKLQEELARCKADKDFVWSLWKQLQKESPDVTEAISLVITREKIKREQEQEELQLTLKDKEAEIEVLREELDHQSQTIAGLEIQLQKLTSDKKQIDKKLKLENERVQEHSDQLTHASEEIGQLKSRLIDKENELQQHLKAVEVLLQRSGCLEQEVKSLTEVKSQLVTEKEELTQQIKQLETQRAIECSTFLKENQCLKKQLEEKTRKREEQLKMKYKEEMKLVQNEMDLLTEEKTSLNNEVMVLSRQLEANQIELKETRRLLTLAESRLHESMKYCSAGPNVKDQFKNLQELLEKTERELFELQTQMKAKNEEIVCVREKHDKRLERMKALKESHTLVLQQLKTYDTNNSPVSRRPHLSPTCKDKRAGRCLKHENTDSVWNELTQYKSKCQQLEIDKVIAEEEVDRLSVLCAQQKSTISELRGCLQQERNILETKITELDTAVSCTSLEQEKFKTLECEQAMLNEENVKLTDQNKILTKECYKLRKEAGDLQQTIIDLQHQWEKDQLSKVTTTSTNTDYIPKIDSAIQVELLPECVSMETDMVCTSTSSLFNSPPLPTRSRTRRHSDTEMIARYNQMTQALDNVRRLNQTLHEPIKSTCQSSYTEKPNQSSQLHKKNDILLPHPHQLETSSKKESQKIYQRDSTHKCKWFVQLKTCQQRLKTLTRQVSVLTMAKRSLTQLLDECQRDKFKVEREIKPLQEKLSSNKTTIQELRAELKSLETTRIELQGRCTGLESIGLKALAEQEKRANFEGENKKLKEEKKILSEKCGSLSEQLKSLQTDLVAKDKEKDTLHDRVSNMERDLKQKRQLIADQKKKLVLLEERTNLDKEKIICLTDQVTSLQESLEHYKHRISSIKSQSEQYAKEKQRLLETFSRCQQDLDNTSHQLTLVQDECRKKTQQLILTKRSGEKKEGEIKRENQIVLLELERRTDIAERTVLNYQEFVMDLARELSSLQQEKQVKASSSSRKQESSLRKDAISERARQIAQTTFDLSDIEVDEFMNDSSLSHNTTRKSEQTTPSLAWKVRQLVQNNEHQLLSRKKLLSEFSSCISNLLSYH